MALSLGLCACARAGEVKLYNSGNQAAEWVKNNPDRPEAKVIQEKIASVPQSIWLTGGPLEGFAKDVKAAQEKDETIPFVTYNIPGRDNGNYSAGGLDNPTGYDAWTKQVATALGTAKAIAVLEPDAIGLGQGLTNQQKLLERYDMLAKAGKALKQDTNCQVYPDVSIWIGPEAAANALKQCGIENLDGFCVNTSAFERTEDCIAFGKKVSALLGGKHFIIDTSRNGNGSWQTSESDKWCNPPGRALGHVPTFDTGDPLIDAYLWVKRPGESDGPCRGGPAPGTFWPKYAYELAKNAK